MSLNYVMLGSNDVEKARGFYEALLPAIGGEMIAEYMPHAFCYQLRGGGRIWVVTPHDQKEATVGNGTMIGLSCESQDEVRTVHRIGLSLGGANEGDPGPRPLYGPDFYGAYLRDLDGNKLGFVHLG